MGTISWNVTTHIVATRYHSVTRGGVLRGFTSGFPFVIIMCAEYFWDDDRNYGHVTFGIPMTKLVVELVSVGSGDETIVEPEAVSLVKEVRYTGGESFYFTAI